MSASIRALRDDTLTVRGGGQGGGGGGTAAAAAGREKGAARKLGLMQVLVNMAAHAEGQRALLHAPSAAGSLELVSALLEPPAGAPRPPVALAERALLLLRNLCFAPEAKPHLLAHPRLLPALLAQVERAAEAPRAAAYASSAIWALMYHGEKASCCRNRSRVLGTNGSGSFR